jgi:predicted unusual protein kinase regulating ubiquinone biosynthesis (AarF/ABC1/UbiB family)
MIHPLQKRRASRTTLNSRRKEIQNCLTAFGVMRGASHPLRGLGVSDKRETHSYRLCKALESLGPVFSAFGIYMSSRVDLLSVDDCFELATIFDQVEALPISIVREVIAQECGRSQEEVFAVFDEVPFESRLTFQSYHALLKNGKAVQVKVVYPKLEEQIESDMELLPLLKEAFTSEDRPSIPIGHVIADFRRTLRRQMNLIDEIKAFEVLAEDAQQFAMLRAPIIHRELSSSKFLTIEHQPGLNLNEMLASFDQTGPGEGRRVGSGDGNAGLEPEGLARRLCLVWLWQALFGVRFPVDQRPENVIVLPNNQIAFAGGTFVSLPADAKKNLWNYLIAASTADPDKACSYLLKEMDNERGAFNEDELRHRFRGIVPFRDGGWSHNGDGSSLAEHLFVQWKLMSERGLRPQPHLLCFYRGLFITVANARRFAPHIDPLLEALQDARTIAMLTQFRETVSLRQLSDNLDKYTAMMMELPQRLDDVLTLAAESSTKLRLQGMGTARRRGQQNNSSTVMLALLLVLAALVLLSHHLAASAVAGAWVDRISAVTFVLIGALLLRAISRMGQGG